MSAMRVPVFVSVPSALSPDQQATLALFEQLLADSGLEPRTLGRSDYSLHFPLKDVYAIARHCSGGLVLGFEQLRVTKGVRKRGTDFESPVALELGVPTPWNQLEAGILFGLGLPMLVFREEGVEGGIFDPGAADAFVQPMPAPGTDRAALHSLFQQWSSRVHERYYRDDRGV